MHVRRRKGWEIAERLATPEAIFVSRRQLLTVGGTALAGVLSHVAQADVESTADLYPVPRNSGYAIERPITPEAVNTRHNSFYEFGAHKSIAAAASALPTVPWDIIVDGLVEEPLTIDFETLVRRMALEERLYRHRSVEAWSMTVPWTGFPLASLVALVNPLADASYLRMEAFYMPEVATGQKQFWYPWPYVEGLTMGEATHELAFVVTGAYGKPLAPVMGAPIRVHVPWKYGFKSIKSIVRFTFTDERPATFWEAVAGSRRGFWANVNPDVAYPGWSQAVERDIATGEIIPTRLFNGYAEYVADLYAGLDDEPLFV